MATIFLLKRLGSRVESHLALAFGVANLNREKYEQTFLD